MLSSVHIQFKQIHSNVFITSIFITAPTYFTVISAGCVECPVEPWQILWVAAGVADRTTLTIPKGVLRVPCIKVNLFWPPITVEVLAYKGW